MKALKWSMLAVNNLEIGHLWPQMDLASINLCERGSSDYLMR